MPSVAATAQNSAAVATPNAAPRAVRRDSPTETRVTTRKAGPGLIAAISCTAPIPARVMA